MRSMNSELSDKVTRVPVAIVGGGFAGTMLAAQLARKGISAALVDGSAQMGRGTAYSTDDPSHLLNIPAERMSAWPIGRTTLCSGSRRKAAHAMVLRSGVYMAATLGKYWLRQLPRGTSRRSAPPPFPPRAMALPVMLYYGSRIEARALALAAGNQSPAALPVFVETGEAYVPNPWRARALRHPALGGRGERSSSSAPASRWSTWRYRSILRLWTWLDRRLVAARAGAPRECRRAGRTPVRRFRGAAKGNLLGANPLGPPAGGRIGWRNAVDSLRPHSHALWQSLSLDHQRRFLRHARPWWDVHRHRIAPEVGLNHRPDDRRGPDRGHRRARYVRARNR